jgi:diphthamide biosynthesis protein 2
MLASDFAGPIEEAFEVGETAQYVLDGKYERVALQFPDELVPHATAVHAALGRLLPSSVSLYVLADCTFDGSQLDYVAAQHVDAQLLVHYGGAQLDVSGPIASRLVFPHRRADARALADALADALEPAGGEAARLALLDTAEHLLVIYQLGYAHAMPALDAAMRARAPGRVTVATVARDFGSASAECAAEEAADGAAAGSGEVLVIEGFRAQLPAGLALSGCALVYVGEEDAPLDAIVLAHCAARTVAPRATPAAGDGAAGDGPSAGAAEGATTTLPELPVLLLDPAAAPPSVRRLLLSSARRLSGRGT